MKKVLIASTALVAAGLMTTGAASASEKIKLNLGGFSKWWVVGAWNDDSFQGTNNVDYNSVDVKGDNEIFFGGSTTLDNGMKVGIDVQLEAGGNGDTTTDTIDESYVWIEGGFGKFIVGSENNGAYLLHVSAPDAAGNWGDGGIMTGGAALALPANIRGINPTGNTANTTAIATDGDADKITYVAPSFYGLTVGATYVPNSTEDNRGTTSIASGAALSTGEIFGAGALYANTFGGVGLRVSGGYATYDTNFTNGANGAGEPTEDDRVHEWTAGTQLSYAGFTLGGSYRQVVSDHGAGSTLGVGVGGNAYDVGLQYASGPYAVSLSYYRSEVEGTLATAGDDVMEFTQVSGKYTLGAGVDVLASVGYAELDDEVTTNGTDNSGWTAMTGLSLAF